MRFSETGTASGANAGGWRERFVFVGGLAAIVAGAGGCSTALGYDSITFEDGDTSKRPLDRECIPEHATGPLDDACGAFVSAATGDDAAGRGTKDHPFRTLGRAIGASKAVYACNDAAFEEAVVIDSDTTIFGGLDCARGWAVAPMKRTTWRGVAGQPVVRVADLARADLHDLVINAPDAASPGESSIAILAGALATLEVHHAAISAGRGAGAAPPPMPGMPGMPGPPGTRGGDGCMGPALATEPGTGGAGVCGDRDVSGGAGGPGLAGSSGADGSDGNPAPGSDKEGSGGKKQDLTACGSGSGGEKGEAGADGAGALGIGALGPDGYLGVAGQDGAPGEPGQGGGGGGGARLCWNAKAGPAGGGGGAGGCGGAGGRGGSPGGASIGIVSLNATLILADVVITAESGGKGADGAPGGPGGKGGFAGAAGQGDAVSAACTGGKGGDGGKGGRGGGGTGGPSIAIAYRGSPPPAEGVELVVGAPGDGGKGEGAAGEGAPGVAAKTQEMP